MKFTCSVEIDLPRNKAVELFKDPNNLKEWQDGFVSITHLSGTPEQAGAKSSMIYMIRGKEMELIETILVNNFPFEFVGEYAAKSMTNTMRVLFTEIDRNKTRLVYEIHYTQLNGLFIKVFAFLMPSMFKKQTQKWLDQFKAFAESV